MPELPEVETLCRQLNAIISGKKIIKVEVLDRRLGDIEGVAGGRVAAVVRRGKTIEIRLDETTFEIHLRMTGRLLWQDETGPPPPHTRLVVSFSAGRLLLIDPRRFATCRVRTEAPPAALIENPLAGLPAGRLREIARGRRLPVKNFLMDQRLVAGIGNIYACEILHEAAVDPRRPACSLAQAQWRRMEKAAAIILPRAVECRGTTVSDWRDLFGAGGTNQDHLRVYAREGSACPRCGGRIERAKLAGRGTWFCPACQK